MAIGISRNLAESFRPGWTLRVVQLDSAPAAEHAVLAAMDEEQLVAACLAGERRAFDLIVERHRRTVYQLCYRFVGNHEDARDLSQDVFIRAYRRLGKVRGGASLATWLYRIGVNVCLNHVSVKVPASEPIEVRQHVDLRT